MASQLKTLYEELGRAFFKKPSDLNKCVAILSKLKVCSLLTGLAHSYSFSQDRTHRGWFTSPSRRCDSWRSCRCSFVPSRTELTVLFLLEEFQATSWKSAQSAASEAMTFPRSTGTFLNYRYFTQITGLFIYRYCLVSYN